jgi:ABC-type lipoprotein export system ATPase subunit
MSDHWGAPVDPSGAAARLVEVDQVYRLPSTQVVALDGVSVELVSGAVNVVAGPSGSGKSTLLRLVGLLEHPTAGRVEVAGKDVTDLSARGRRRLRRHLIAYVFQRPLDNLVEGVDAAGQLHLAARLSGAPAPDPEELLGVLGLAHRAHASIRTMSGGEQQRLAFAAALASRPALIVADEPTAQLDHASGALVIEALATLRAAGATVVVSSHDPAVAEVADHVVQLSSGRVVTGVPR